MCGSVMTRTVTTVSFRTTIVQGISDGPVDRLSILAESIASSLLAPRERRLVEKRLRFPGTLCKDRFCKLSIVALRKTSVRLKGRVNWDPYDSTRPVAQLRKNTRFASLLPST